MLCPLRRFGRTLGDARPIQRTRPGDSAHIGGGGFGLNPRALLLMPRLLEQAVYFFIRRLREVVIPASHAQERFRCLAADDFVDLRLELLAGL